MSFTKFNIRSSWNCLRQIRLYSTKDSKPPEAAKPPEESKECKTPKEDKPDKKCKLLKGSKPAKDCKPCEAAKPPAAAKPPPAAKPPEAAKPPAATKAPAAAKPPEAVEPQKYQPRPRKVGIVGVPFKMGQKKDGVDDGPLALRAALKGVLERVKTVQSVEDFGDVCTCGIKLKPVVAEAYKCNNLSQIGPLNVKLSERVNHVIKENQTAVVLGGDHSIGIGSIHGHVTALGKNKVAVIWVDAHADINTPTSSGSGSVHGMPLSLLLEETRHFWPQNIPGLEWQKPVLHAYDLAYIGLRDVDPWEKLIIAELNICAFDMKKVSQQGIEKVIKQVMAAIDPDGNHSIHVSFDIDAIDPTEAPSTGTPVPGGLQLKQGIKIMQAAFATGRLDVVDLVEVNPKLGSPEDVKRTTAAAVELILGACGKVPVGK